MQTNLIGRHASYFDKAAGKDGTTYIGPICVLYEQVDPRIAPRVGIEVVSGQIKTAPIDDVWLLETPTGEVTGIGAQILADVQKEIAGGGTGKATG